VVACVLWSSLVNISVQGISISGLTRLWRRRRGGLTIRGLTRNLVPPALVCFGLSWSVAKKGKRKTSIRNFFEAFFSFIVPTSARWRTITCRK
jgi:hypothetical protein